MGKVVLKCRFITPAFIYGVNNKPELRTPSIKGLMRFWWRATYKEFVSIEEMKKTEAEIFGGKYMKNGKEVYKKAKVQISSELIKPFEEIKNGSLLEENKEKEGYNYLFYSMVSLNGNKEKKHFNVGTKFKITFEFLDKNKYYVKDYLKAFNALQLFGGIGARSRRGGGNFIVEEIDDNPDLNEEEILKYVYVEKNNNNKDVLHYYKQIFANTKILNINSYSNVFSNSSKVYLCSFDNQFDKKNIKNDNPFFKLLECDLCGNFYFEDNINSVGNIYKTVRNDTKHKRDNGRGASPLVIKVVKDNNICRILLIKLAGKFKENKLVDEFLYNCQTNKSIKMKNLNKQRGINK